MGFGFGKRPPVPEPRPLLMEPPKIIPTDLLWNVGLGIFCLLAVLFIGQVARLLMFIGGKLSHAMVRTWQAGWLISVGDGGGRVVLGSGEVVWPLYRWRGNARRPSADGATAREGRGSQGLTSLPLTPLHSAPRSPSPQRCGASACPPPPRPPTAAAPPPPLPTTAPAAAAAAGATSPCPPASPPGPITSRACRPFSPPPRALAPPPSCTGATAPPAPARRPPRRLPPPPLAAPTAATPAAPLRPAARRARPPP
jgi:hypothetical protein